MPTALSQQELAAVFKAASVMVSAGVPVSDLLHEEHELEFVKQLRAADVDKLRANEVYDRLSSGCSLFDDFHYLLSN